jgi:uncharacterized protein
MKKSIMTLLLLGFVGHLLAQQHKAHLRMIGAAFGDSVILRWSIANAEAWSSTNVAGFILERSELDERNRVVGKPYQLMGNDTIRPWPYASLEARIDRKDTFALIAAQCLYGKRKAITETTDLIEALKQADDDLTMRFGVSQLAADLSAGAANLLGWRWVDGPVKKGHKYIYRLYSAARAGVATSDTAVYIVRPEEYHAVTAPDAPTLIPSDRRVAIVWKKQPQFTAYYPERSEDGIHFKRLTDKPYLEWVPRDRVSRDSLTFVDSVGANYKPYYYRLVGINPFAMHSPVSEVAIGMAIDLTPPLPPDGLQGQNTKTQEVQLHWELPEAIEPLQGIVVGKTPDPGQPIVRLNETLLPSTASTYIDEHAWQFGTSFYAVGIVDTAGNIGWSPLVYVVMNDEAPPIMPTGLKGSIDTLGNVALAWDFGLDFDLKGYQVYAANQADHAFIPLSDTLITDTMFQYKIDLLNLTEHIYYRVRAFDKNLKESVFSKPLELKKPDLIPPDAPVLNHYEVTASGVYLHWRNASAKDVAAQQLLRRKPGSDWEILAKLPKENTSFTDSMLLREQFWEYAVQAVDDSNLKSAPSFPITIKVPPLPKKQVLANIRAIWDEKRQLVVLDWSLAPPPCTRLLIYRGYNNEGLEMLKSVDQGTAHFEDTQVLRPGDYAYALKPIYPDGAEGPLSDLVTIHKQ